MSVFTYVIADETRRIAEESQENAAVTDGFFAYIVSLRLPYPYMPALRLPISALKIRAWRSQASLKQRFSLQDKAPRVMVYFCTPNESNAVLVENIVSNRHPLGSPRLSRIAQNIQARSDDTKASSEGRLCKVNKVTEVMHIPLVILTKI